MKMTVTATRRLAAACSDRDPDPDDCDLARSVAPPSAGAPFGYDVFGCDYLAQTVYGARASLVVAVLVVGATTLVALVLGSLAGYAGGWVDALVTRVADVWSGIFLVLGGVVLLSATDERGILQVALVLAVFGWPAMVRVLRVSVLEVKGRDYVLAARALGADRGTSSPATCSRTPARPAPRKLTTLGGWQYASRGVPAP